MVTVGVVCFFLLWRYHRHSPSFGVLSVGTMNSVGHSDCLRSSNSISITQPVRPASSLVMNSPGQNAAPQWGEIGFLKRGAHEASGSG